MNLASVGVSMLCGKDISASGLVKSAATAMHIWTQQLLSAALVSSPWGLDSQCPVFIICSWWSAGPTDAAAAGAKAGAASRASAVRNERSVLKLTTVTYARICNVLQPAACGNVPAKQGDKRLPSSRPPRSIYIAWPIADARRRLGKSIHRAMPTIIRFSVREMNPSGTLLEPPTQAHFSSRLSI